MSATVSRTSPADAAECARLLEGAARDRRTVRIKGSGTKSYVGDVGPADIEISTSRLAGVIDHVPADLTVTVGGGTRVADVMAALARAGQFLPLDPPHADEATIGGVIAANSNGFWRSRYGAVRDLLIGTRIALGDGSIAKAGGRVVKNVAGYDLDKLLVGSFGTLGVIVEATLKVPPVPPASDGLAARLVIPLMRSPPHRRSPVAPRRWRHASWSGMKTSGVSRPGARKRGHGEARARRRAAGGHRPTGRDDRSR